MLLIIMMLLYFNTSNVNNQPITIIMSIFPSPISIHQMLIINKKSYCFTMLFSRISIHQMLIINKKKLNQLLIMFYFNTSNVNNQLYRNLKLLSTQNVISIHQMLIINFHLVAALMIIRLNFNTSNVNNRHSHALLACSIA